MVIHVQGVIAKTNDLIKSAMLMELNINQDKIKYMVINRENNIEQAWLLEIKYYKHQITLNA